ncbi:serine protease [Shimia litoralis]|uniref:Serine protease n=1 Tax=Shimia litoralis TaxID=420403 RepID=A0A4U7MY74_9RHOB|nr:serine protease [Shimia litoralis]TKZ18028.1 serine protease [Shimia litoralis]
MKKKSLIVSSVVLSFVLAAGSQAQEFNPPSPDATLASPFAYAESQKKAEHAKEVAASDSGSKVIGGEVSREGAWPWQVALVIGGQNPSPDSQFCGGSMILDNWVLTAAHCIHMADDQGVYRDIHPSRFAVVAGTNKLDGGSGDMIPVEAVFRHPSYDGNEFDHDVALIKLQRAPRVRYETIKVPDAEFGDILERPGVTTIVTGWGLTEGGNHPDRLHETQIQMLDRDMCNSMLLEARATEAVKGFGFAAQVLGMNTATAQSAWEEFIRHVRDPLTANMICSGSLAGGKTSCQGDSGGPLVVPLNDGSYIQAGIVSWGLSSGNGKTCAEDAIFSAYTRTANYVDWLNQTIQSND